MKIIDIVPDFFTNIGEFLNKQGIQAKVNIILEKTDNNQGVTSQRLMQVMAQEISFK